MSPTGNHQSVYSLNMIMKLLSFYSLLQHISYHKVSYSIRRFQFEGILRECTSPLTYLHFPFSSMKDKTVAAHQKTCKLLRHKNSNQKTIPHQGYWMKCFFLRKNMTISEVYLKSQDSKSCKAWQWKNVRPNMWELIPVTINTDKVLSSFKN